METCANAYEEARKQRVQENRERFEGMGISMISKSLLEVTTCETKRDCRSPKSVKSLDVAELRRSSRARNLVSTYQDEDAIDLQSLRRSYSKRPDSGIRIASYEERVLATKKAEKFQTHLSSCHPSFIKSMLRSHVSSCFWMGLPNRFCKDNLPSKEVKMILEDEDGQEYEAIYIGSRTGLSGGWRGFSLDHKLDDGDALLFELTQPSRFKVYIIKAAEQSNEESDDKLNNTKEGITNLRDTSVESTSASDTQEDRLKTGSKKRVKRPPQRSAWH